MEIIKKHISIQLRIIGVTFSTGISTCDIWNRITHKDTGINITSTNEPCELFLQSASEKQVVAAFYDLKFDCAEPNAKGNIEIYDGTDPNRQIIISNCQKPFGHNVSYASRRNGLTIRLVKPYKPFKLQVYSIDVIKNYTRPIGIIVSERYPGYYSNKNTMTTPNNYHAFYNIVMDEKVTIRISFKELYVEEGPVGTCRDFVKVHGILPSSQLCGENKLHSQKTTITDKLSIEFQTDSVTSYTGFEVDYVACFNETQGSNKTMEFRLPEYQLKEQMRCFLDVKVTERRRVIINMTIYSNSTGKECTDIIKIEAVGIKATDRNMSACTVNTAFTLDITVSSLLRLILTSESRYEYVNGTYRTEKPGEETTISTSKDSSSSKVYTTSTFTDYMTSSDENINAESAEQNTPEAINKNIIIIATVLAVSLLVIVIIVLILVRRNSSGDRQKQKEKEQKPNKNQNGRVDSEKNRAEDIYVGNESYDIVRTKRKHKTTKKDGSDNTYEGTNGPQNVYAVVNRMKSPQRGQGADEYDDHRFEIVYDHTERHPVKARDENFYE